MLHASKCMVTSGLLHASTSTFMITGTSGLLTYALTNYIAQSIINTIGLDWSCPYESGRTTFSFQISLSPVLPVFAQDSHAHLGQNFLSLSMPIYPHLTIAINFYWFYD